MLLHLPAQALDRPLVVDWARQVGTPEFDFGYSLAMDPAGNLVLLSSTVSAFPGHTNLGARDGYMAKYDPQGNELWSMQFGTPEADSAADVGIDAAGNIYVVGGTTGVLDTQPNAGGSSAYLKKFDPNGVLQWTRGINAPGNDAWGALALDRFGNVYVGGQSSEDETGISTHMDLSKYSPSGALISSERFDSNVTGLPRDMEVAPDGSVYFAGAVTTVTKNNGRTTVHQNATFSRYSPDSDVIWTQSFGDLGDDAAHSLAIDEQGSVYLTGTYTPGFGDYLYSGFLQRYTPEGQLLWEQTYPSCACIRKETQSYAVALDPEGKPFVAGGTWMPYLPDSFSYYSTANHGSSDAFVIQFDKDGGLNHIPTLIGKAQIETATEMVIGPDGRVYLLGHTNGLIAGDANAGTYDLILIALSFVLPGDTDADGDVDDSDIANALAAYTGPEGRYNGFPGYRQGNADGDYDIDDSDLGTLFANYTGPKTIAIPEPASLGFLTMAGVVGLVRRRV